MATAEQLKAILRSYAEGDEERFFAVSLQIAADAARKGHEKLARELRQLVDDAKRRSTQPPFRSTVPIARPAGELGDLVVASFPKTRLVDMVLSDSTRSSLQRVVVEYRQQEKLRAHALSARRKLLLVGPPGCGKTMTASALAGELSLPLLAIRLDGIITKYMGETAAKLRQVFDAMITTRGVYLFDEFDSIGGDRSRGNDVGEIRRVLNSFLQFLEADDSDSVILGATNHEAMLDSALYRRFDDVIRYGSPTPEHVQELVANRLNGFQIDRVDWYTVQQAGNNLSYAEISRACGEAAKSAVLEDRHQITTEQICYALEERRMIQRTQ